MITRRGVLKLLAGGWFAGLALLGYATGAEAMGRPRATRIRLAPKRWAPGLRLRVAVLSDIHACDPWMGPDRIRAICAEANALQADLILLLGDYATSMKLVTGYPPFAETAAALSTLRARLGVHAILGNHDYWADPDFQEERSETSVMGEALTEAGIPVYVNRAVRIDNDGQPFWLAGLGDQMAYRPSRRFNRRGFVGIDDLETTLSGIADDAPVILMAHEPYVFPAVPERVALTLSGHTHGGQINFFGWAPFVDNPADLAHLYGHYRGEHGDLVVSRGIGCSAIPMRIGAWPEIVLLELGEA
ncbi:metallophosphoesterase [Gellertiella hungarica]|uniref:Calcineurin-like phosphoesterase domain-containing protein n=1 Tax=Gellertiella hungarica TaxID=1572859 RepID=A0A7W6J1R2_9HYPH|nr:metallophosphoesterase [Gellertiella hungarica]MBB4063163.1 hypothetical protein [Gellertiella hungarica]